MQGRNFLWWAIVSASITLLRISPALPQQVQNSGTAAQRKAESENPIIVYTIERASADNAAARAALLDKVRQTTRMRVIAGLRMTMQSEDALSADARAQQHQSLRGMQEAVVARVLGQSLRARVSDPRDSTVVAFDYIPYLSLYVTPSQLARLLNDPQVVSVQEDIPNRPMLADSAPLIRADELWDVGVNGGGYVVAVLDTGVDKSHPMLKNKVVSEACYSTNNGKNTVSVCPGGATSSTSSGSGVHCSVDGCDHGTHVASIVAGGGRGVKLKGIAPSAQIIAVQVFTRENLAKDCAPGAAPCVTNYDTDLVKGLERVYALRKDWNIAAVNLSLGGGKFSTACDSTLPSLTSIMTKLKAAHIAVVAASGNDSWDGFISRPGCISKAFAVGNTEKDDTLAPTSNHSALVRLLAPGSDINAAVPGNTYEKKTGTSMAAPHVAGAFALLKAAKNNATPDQIAAALGCNGISVSRAQVPKPRIDVAAARDHLDNPPKNVFDWKFSAPAEANDWTPVLGTWAVKSGSYRTTKSATNSFWNFSSITNCYPEFSLTARMKRTDPTSGGWHSGLFLKATIDATRRKSSGLWFAYYKRGSTIGVQVWRQNEYDLILDDGPATLLCDQTSSTKFDAFIDLKIVAGSRQYDFYINNQRICRVSDASFAVADTMVGAVMPKGSQEAHKLEVDSVALIAIGNPADAAADTVIDPAAFARKPPRVRFAPAGF